MYRIFFVQYEAYQKRAEQIARILEEDRDTRNYFIDNIRFEKEEVIVTWLGTRDHYWHTRFPARFLDSNDSEVEAYAARVKIVHNERFAKAKELEAKREEQSARSAYESLKKRFGE